jgi:DNA-3-methyladenine glycosylase I
VVDIKGVVTGPDRVARCWWCVGDPLYESYHDHEWGRPIADDGRLFEKLSLEGFQSGLSWLTILRKRENFRRAFRSFDLETVARFNRRSVQRLMGDAGIVRNLAKIEATINNARRCLELIEEFGSLAAFSWNYEPDVSARSKSIDHDALVNMPPSPEATAFSKELRKRGWVFVGPTTAYSFMEAVGIVNDHLFACDLRAEVERDREDFSRPTGTPRGRAT